ncbi:MAG: hypothetical protein JXX14_05360 [Deltaproteobacteria bacterium]|nr:hypothetical protein [Deltaproteobacteria bacterium]
MMIRWFGMALLTLLLAANAFAEEKEARRAFDSGSALFEAGQFTDAAEQFRLAYREKPSWKLFYNIGQCEAGAKNYGLALEAFERYITEAGDEIDEQRFDEVQKEISRLKPLVGFLRIAGPDGTTVKVDGIVRGTLPLSGLIPVSAARDHTIDGENDHAELVSQKVKLMTGQTLSVTLGNAETESSQIADQPSLETDAAQDTTAETNAGSANDSGSASEANVAPVTDGEENSATSPSDETPAATPSNAVKNAGIAMIVGGGAVLAGGFALGGTAFIKGSELDDNNPNGVSGEALNDRDSYKKMALVGDILMGVGGAAVITGAILLLANRKRKHEKLNTQLVPAIGNGGAVLLKGWF